MRGVPSLLEVMVFAWLIAPILIAYFLSRTGQYESAHVLSSLSLTGLVTVVAIGTGGIGSLFAVLAGGGSPAGGVLGARPGGAAAPALSLSGRRPRPAPS